MTTHPKAKLTAAEVVARILTAGNMQRDAQGIGVELIDRYAAEQTESLRAELSHVRLELEAMRVERDEAIAQNRNLSLQLAIRSAGGQA